jgi:predicted transcriptional regulator
VSSPVCFKEIQNTQKRVDEGTGMSERTIRQILKEQEKYEQETSFECLARSITYISKLLK